MLHSIIRTFLTLSVESRFVMEKYLQTNMEPSFIATPYVQASSPSSRRIRALLDEQEAAYLHWRASRKPVKHRFASAKLNSPVKMVVSVEKTAAIPLWMTLSNQAKDDNSPGASTAVNTRKSLSAPDQHRRTSTTSVTSTSLKTPYEEVVGAPRSRLGSISTPSLPRLSETDGIARSTSSKKQARLTDFLPDCDGPARTRSPGLVKKRLQEHLYSFHSSHVFSFAANAEGELPNEGAQQDKAASKEPVKTSGEKADSAWSATPAAHRRSIALPTSDLHQETCVLEGVSFMSAQDYAKIFDHDWKLSEVDRVVRDAVERNRIYMILKTSYRVLLWFFRFYAGKSALASGVAHLNDLYQIPSKLKLLEDLNVQCVDPAKYGIADTPLKRDALVGFLLSVAKMSSTHAPNPARLRVLVAEGIEMSDAVTSLVRDHFGVYAQIQDVNHFRFVFLRKWARSATTRRSRRVQDILAKHKLSLEGFFKESVKAHMPAHGATKESGSSSPHSLTMTFAAFLSTLRAVNLISNPKPAAAANTHGSSGPHASSGIEEGRALRVFLSCLGMSELESMDRDLGVSTSEATFEQFVEALLRVVLMQKELVVCGGGYDVCPGQLTSELCQCDPESVKYDFDAFDDAVEELFTAIHAHRLKHARKRSCVKMAPLRSLGVNGKQNNALQRGDE